MKYLRLFSVALCFLVLVATVALASDQFSAVPMHPTAIAKAKALGKSVSPPSPAGINQGRKFAPGGEVILPLVTAPAQKVLVVLVDFADQPPGFAPNYADKHMPLSYFEDMLFGTTYFPAEYAGIPGAPSNRTLKNFYNLNSYGQVAVTTDNLPTVLGWVHLPHPYSYYNQNNLGYGAFPNNVGGMVLDALKLADANVNFASYAVNGVVPNIFIVHAGSGAEWNGDNRLFWSHSWSLASATGTGTPYVFDGVQVNQYALMPEVGGDTTNVYGDPTYTGPFPPTVGVYAHEYGHVLGLPDQYDYGYESDGTGVYSLMAGGSWNQYPWDTIVSGNSPSNLDAWSKYRLGFVQPIEITGTAVGVTLKPAELYPDIYKMVVPNSGGKEYFLFENRQHIDFDQGLGYWGGVTHGLAIYHIDDVVLTRNYWRPNEAENWKEFRSLGFKRSWTGEMHYGISLLQADGRWELEHGAYLGNFPYSGDLYPGKWGVTRFDSYTSPNSSSYYFWNGSDVKFGYSGVTVQNIVETGQEITADFSFVPYIKK